MRPHDLLEMLREFYGEKLGLKQRHEAGARAVSTYDFNNTYQYVITREEGHLDWLRRAIAGAGGSVPGEAAAPPLPEGGQADVIADDARLMDAFIARWRPRIEQVTDSRQKLMLRVMLGEMLEQHRFFEQAQAGRTDLLGRRTSPSPAAGSVLPTRWVE